jgi:catechol 2,3-dioxygenase-like lactoylglutathione lyase family enzyme
MSVQLPSSGGLHHVALRTSDFATARAFYLETLGFAPEIDAPDFLQVRIGGTAVRIHGPTAQTPTGDRFTPHRTGLDHLAVSCPSRDELDRVASALTAAGVTHTGVKDDPWFHAQYLAFKAPDGTSWELYRQ